MRLSIIIPAFNEENRLAATIAGLRRACDENALNEYELIVADNGSTDRTPDIATTAGARLVQDAERQIATARNSGAAGATGTWLFFVDADTLVSVATMAAALQRMRRSDCVGVGATMEVIGGSLINRLRMERLNPLFRWLRIGGGAFLACRREDFSAIGGFDTNLYAYEDIDLVLRLKTLGRPSGRKFAVISEAPIQTSGRRAGGWKDAVQMIGANVAATLLFVLHYILPGPWIRALGRRTMGYWYNVRR